MDTFITGIIGEKVDGDQVAYDILQAFKDGHQKITLRINSVGGNVINGYSIIQAMDYIKTNKGIVETINTGAAYSMAGIILACGSKGHRKSYPHAQTMVHAPRYKDDMDIDESMKTQLNNTFDGLVNILSTNSNIGADECRTMMENTTFLTAQQCKERGLIDNILKMHNKMNDLLNLGADASETATREAILNLRAEALKGKEAVNELAIAQNEITKLQGIVNELKVTELKAKAEKMVNEAIESKKINAETKELWIENAISNYEATEKMLNSLIIETSIQNKLISPDDKKQKAMKFKEALDKGDFKTLETLKEYEAIYAEMVTNNQLK